MTDKKSSDKLDWRETASIFAITLLATIGHHIFETGVKVAFLFDGRHYFDTCQRVTQLWLAFFSHHGLADAQTALKDYILLDGPVLPFFFGTIFALIKHVPTGSDWLTFAIIQSVLHALTAAILAQLCFWICQEWSDRKFDSRIATASAALAGLLWGLYPSAVIASGRLMTETLAVFLLASLIYVLVKAKKQDQLGLRVALAAVGGLLVGFLTLLKPGMIPSVGLCLAIFSLSSLKSSIKEGLPVTVALIAGAVIVCSPWMLYTKKVTGVASLTVQRMPVHNALIGWDPETGGWQTNPPSGFERVMNYGDQPLPIIEGIWLSHPEFSLRIFIEKFAHLYLAAWNDYRCPVWTLPDVAQRVLHILTLIFGISGAYCLVARLVQRRIQHDYNSVPLTQMLCLAAAAGQFVYLLFEPVSRYAFPTMLFVPLFAGSLLSIVYASRLVPDRLKIGDSEFSLSLTIDLNKTVITLGLLSMICTTVGVLFFSAALGQMRLAEDEILLIPSQKISGEISIPDKARRGQSFLLIDADKNIESAEVKINGAKTANFLPFAYFSPSRYQAFNLLKEVGYSLNESPDDFRQWRAVPLPDDWAQSKSVQIEIVPTKLSTLYGDKRQPKRMRSPDYLCVNRLINAIYSQDMRVASPIQLGHDVKKTWNNSGNPRIMIASAHGASPDVQSNLAEPNSTDLSFEQLIRQDNFNLLLHGPGDTIKISKSILKAAPSVQSVIDLPHATNGKPLAVTLSGEIRGARDNALAGVVLSFKTHDGKELLFARLPGSVRATKEWSKFSISDISPHKIGNEDISSIGISLLPGPWQQVAGYGCDKSCTDFEFKNLSLTAKTIDLANIEGRTIHYY